MMAGFLKALIIVEIIFLAGCREIPLSQHRKEYYSGRVYQEGFEFFTTTKAHLDKIWGTWQEYRYWGSDDKYHYISTQYIGLALESYNYKIPVETEIENTLFRPTFSHELWKYKRVIFKKEPSKKKKIS